MFISAARYSYDQEAEAGYIKLRKGKVDHTGDLVVQADIGEDGKILGIEILDGEMLPDEATIGSNIEGGNHAFLTGQVWGALSRIVEGPADVEMLDTPDGHHKNQVRVTKPSGTYLVAVIVENALPDA